MAAPKAIIFDLGNVLLPIDLMLTYQAFAAFSPLSESEIATKIKEDELWVPYESGLQTDEEFRDFLRDRLALSCTDSAFDEAFSALLLSYHEGVYDWIASLRSNYHLILLSNTSSIHAERFTQIALGPEGQNLFSLFHQVYFSFDMGMVKPDPAIYQRVLSEQGFKPNEVLFFDDNLANIQSANKLGIHAHLVDPSRSLVQIQAILSAYVDQ
jgi:putative hydrolase of the HAD superfamily